MSHDRFVLNCRGRKLDCRPGSVTGIQVMGVLNVTPDSFSDGGQFTDVNSAVAHAGRMLSEGASMIDVGGESSRPSGAAYGEGAQAVPEDEELSRILPVIERLLDAHPDAIISVDTYKASVAERVLKAGAHIINDITALRASPDMAEVCAAFGAPLILMHSTGSPGDMPHQVHAKHVVSDVQDALRQAIDRARKDGVDQLILDPGFGFGKTNEGNLALLAAADIFLEEGWPVMVGISRKSTIGNMLGRSSEPRPIMGRLHGTLGATAAAIVRGASIIRTHDVQPTVDMIKLLTATLAQREGASISFHET